MTGSAAASASHGRRPCRQRNQTKPSATERFSSTSGDRSIATVGPPIQKNGTASHDCTPSM